jgi:hypothetical protein
MRHHLCRLFFASLFLTSFSSAALAQFGGQFGGAGGGRPNIIRVATPQSEALRAKMEEALNRKVELEFSATPLTQVAVVLSEKFGMPVVLDTVALDQAGISPDDPLTISVSGVSLRSAIKLMFRELELTCLLKDEVLVITSEEAAANYLETRVYEVTSLAANMKDGAFVVRLGTTAEMTQRVNTLCETIRNSVQPDSWDELGGIGTMDYLAGKDHRYFLTVTQTEKCHYELKQLLTKLATVMDQPQATDQDPEEVLIRVYPVTQSAVTAEQAKELLELTLEQIDWSEPLFIKVVGNTLVIKQTAQVHAQINVILNDLVELTDKTDK